MPLKIAAMILAAGQASRFGSCKQLAQCQNQPIIQSVINAAAPLAGDIHIITGHWHPALSQAQTNGTIHGGQLHYNPDWKDGMGRSIAYGVTQLAAEYDGIMILLSDQVALRSDHIQTLLDAFTGDNIVCSRYQHRRGAPALFPASCFPQLQQLAGDRGAQKLLNSSTLPITERALPEAAIDIDTPEALADWTQAILPSPS